ncbi:GNAT family N-acetyltransferase [Kocuria polaris]|nr:GNAT family N-acetyltransferase [Kocuria polaris]
MTSPPLPPWPQVPPACGAVLLRPVRDDDAAMARELATDPYVISIGSLTPATGEAEALAWVRRQQQRYVDNAGFSFAIAESATDTAVGHCGLWLKELSAGRASAGYAVTPTARGKGHATAALVALVRFAWTIEELHRIALYIEPWNIGSIRTAERAGFAAEGLLRSYQEIGGVRRDMLLYAAVRP